MPTQDGTGPMGRGPLSGRGMGQCQNQAVRGIRRDIRDGTCRFQTNRVVSVDLATEKRMLEEDLKAVEQEIKNSKNKNA